MNVIKVSDGKNTFTRISKQAAFKRFVNDQKIVLCPVKLRPGFPWAPHMIVFPTKCKEEGYDFSQMVNNFQWFNCNSNEVGLYAAFYVTG